MSSSSRVLHIDLETYSDVDLTKCGVYRYSESPQFEIQLFGYAYDDDPVKVIDLACGERLPQEVLSDLNDPNVLKMAHNAVFEQTCLKAVGLVEPNTENQWGDTMVTALRLGLPSKLDTLSKVLKLEKAKLETGTALINFFAKPRKPTKNNASTKNDPRDYPEKWKMYKEYNLRDVEAERELDLKLSRLEKQPSWEREVYLLDRRINDRGVYVDIDYVDGAIEIDTLESQENLGKLQEMTGLENPNSNVQFKQWLARMGVECESFTKNTSQEILKGCKDDFVAEAINLKLLCSKTSTAKYEAVQRSMCKDHRVRGLFQYYGANRSGRWAGRLVQLQNLPQNHCNEDELKVFKGLVKARDLEAIKLIWGNVPDILSQGIRSILTNSNGKFIVADYSAIEARVIAWLANEKWRMDLFKRGGDIYCESASRIFGVPVEKHGVNGHLRQRGKVSELACIAEGELVLTDVGLVPIEKVTRSMKLWDGVEWVNHDGVIYKGEREVMTYDGLTATKDHIVCTENEGCYREIQFADASKSGSHLVQSGDGWKAIWVGENNRPAETLDKTSSEKRSSQRLLNGIRVGSMPRMWANQVDKPKQHDEGSNEGLPELYSETTSTRLAREKVHCSETTLREPERQGLQELWWKGHKVLLRLCDRSLLLHARDLWGTEQGTRIGQNRRKWKLRTGKPSMGNTPSELPKSKKVFDILNAGPRHRYTVSNRLVHNCGYGGSLNAMKAMGAEKAGLSDDEILKIVEQWREASPNIVRLWTKLDEAVTDAIVYKQHTSLDRGLQVYMEGNNLIIQLPSGRRLVYQNARYDKSIRNPNKKSILYDSMNQITRKWEATETYGGKLTENVVQAIARDCLAWAMVRLDKAGYQIVGHVHDEVIIDAFESDKLDEVCAIMGQELPWAKGLYLTAAGYECESYLKD